MKAKVYIETSVVSYLTSAPSRDLVAIHSMDVLLTLKLYAHRECRGSR